MPIDFTVIKIISFCMIGLAVCDFLFTFNKRELVYYRAENIFDEFFERKYKELKENSIESRKERFKQEVLNGLRTKDFEGGFKMNNLIYAMVVTSIFMLIGIFLRFIDLGMTINKALLRTFLFPFEVPLRHIQIFHDVRKTNFKKAMRLLLLPITDLPQVIISIADTHMDAEAKILASIELLHELRPKHRLLIKVLKHHGITVTEVKKTTRLSFPDLVAFKVTWFIMNTLFEAKSSKVKNVHRESNRGEYQNRLNQFFNDSYKLT